MIHPPIKSLEKYATDKLYLLTHKKDYEKIKEHLNSCKGCKFYIDAYRQAREQRRLNSAKDIIELKKAGKIIAPARYRDGEQCPDEEILANFIDSTLSTEETKNVQAHLNLCDSCSESVQDVKKHLYDRTPIEPIKTAFKATTIIPLFLIGVRNLYDRRLRKHIKVVFVSATIISLFLIGIIVLPEMFETKKVDTRSEVSPLAIQLKKPTGEIVTSIPRFEWITTLKADSFIVIVSFLSPEAIQSQLWRKATSALYLDYPIDKAQIEINKKYYWKVEAILDGKKIASSEMKEFWIK